MNVFYRLLSAGPPSRYWRQPSSMYWTRLFFHESYPSARERHA